MMVGKIQGQDQGQEEPASKKDNLQTSINNWITLLKDWEALRTEAAAGEGTLTQDQFDDLKRKRKLDSTLKKCNGFLRKLRTTPPVQRELLEKEFDGLNLTKFLEEISSAMCENSSFKVRDLVILCSRIHKRYVNFSSTLLDTFKNVLSSSKGSDGSNDVDKLGWNLRLLSELILSGVIDSNDGPELLLDTFKALLQNDKEVVQNLKLFPNFNKAVIAELTGIVPAPFRKFCEDNSIDLPVGTCISTDTKKEIRIVLKIYLKVGVCFAMNKLNDLKMESELKNRRLLSSRGEIPEDQAEAHLKLVKDLEDLWTNAKKFADLIDESLAKLRELAPEPPEHRMKVSVHNFGDPQNVSRGSKLFDDEEVRSFYQDLPDMTKYLTKLARKDVLTKLEMEAKANAEREAKVSKIDERLQEGLCLDDEKEPDELEDDHCAPLEKCDSDKIGIVKVPYDHAAFVQFLNSLDRAVGRNFADQAAVDFLERFNNKGTRRKLVEHLYHCPRNRYDLLPYWSRFVALLAPVVPEIYLELGQNLIKQFRFLIKKKDNSAIELKIKFTRFISELVKFELISKADAFNCFKILLSHFVHHQVEMAIAFLESCGQYLYRRDDTHLRMKLYLEQMQRKVQVGVFEPRYKTLLDHVYYHVVDSGEGKEEDEGEDVDVRYAYMLHLIENLNDENLNSSIENGQSFNWNDPKIKDFWIEIFSEPWTFCYQKVQYLASFLCGITEYNVSIRPSIIDNLVAELVQGLQLYEPLKNQRLLTIVTFLGELFNYRFYGGQLIIDLLYTVLLSNTIMDHSVVCPGDPPESLFRVRLACTIVNVCGEYMMAPPSDKKLRIFMVALERYFFFKISHPIWNQIPFPYELKELLRDSLKLTNLTCSESYEEAGAKLERIRNKLEKNNKIQKEQSNGKITFAPAPTRESRKAKVKVTKLKRRIRRRTRSNPEQGSRKVRPNHRNPGISGTSDDSIKQVLREIQKNGQRSRSGKKELSQEGPEIRNQHVMQQESLKPSRSMTIAQGQENFKYGRNGNIGDTLLPQIDMFQQEETQQPTIELTVQQKTHPEDAFAQQFKKRVGSNKFVFEGYVVMDPFMTNRGDILQNCDNNISPRKAFIGGGDSTSPGFCQQRSLGAGSPAQIPDSPSRGSGLDEEEESQAPTQEDDAIFDMMFNELVTLGQREGARDMTRKLNSDIPVPIVRPVSGKSLGKNPSVQVRVLARKNNRAVVKFVSVPKDTDFIQRMKAQEELEKKERAELKKITLGINRLQQEEEMKAQVKYLNNLQKSMFR